MLLAVVLMAQTQSSVWDAVYSADQAKRGEAAYAADCASCHGAKLEGRNQAPPLAGEEFLMNWDGQSVGDLFERIQTSMPGDRPGTLKPERNAEIIAYLLSEGKFPAGAADLSVDVEHLKQIRIEAAKPKP